MDSDDKETSRVWRAFKTIQQMLNDRGYLVNPGDLDIDFETFQLNYARNGIDRTSLLILCGKRGQPSEQMVVFFAEDKSVGIKPARKYCERMLTQGVRNGIIIYQQTITSSAAKVFAYVRQTDRPLLVETFPEADLQVNITHHVLVPKHSVLGEEEKKTLLDRYRLKETQLPRILSSDPVARYYGLKPRQVVKIVRPSETAGRYVTYRLCV